MPRHDRAPTPLCPLARNKRDVAICRQLPAGYHFLSSAPACNRRYRKTREYLFLFRQDGEGEPLLPDLPVSVLCIIPAIDVEVSLTRFLSVSWMTEWLQLDPHARLDHASCHVDVLLIQVALLSCVFGPLCPRCDDAERNARWERSRLLCSKGETLARPPEVCYPSRIIFVPNKLTVLLTYSRA